MAIRPDASAKIDTYIAQAPAFARPICTRLRAVIHETDPTIREDWKWGPNFNKKGMVCGFGAFKDHVTLTFFMGALLRDPHRILEHGGKNRHNRSIKFTSPAQVDERLLMGYIKEAIRINEKGIKSRPRPPRIVLPPDLKKALAASKKATEQFSRLAHTHKKEYVNWVKDAKKKDTRKKRVKQAVVRIARGIKMHEMYRTGG